MTSNKDLSYWKLIQFASLLLCIIGSYGFARPVTDSLFYQHHGSSSLPQVFLLSALAAALAMSLYNHFNTRYSLLRLLGMTAILSTLLMLFLLGLYHVQVTGSVYLLYMWREVYMVLLVEIFWSLADTLFNLKSAQRSYGLVLAIGSIGGVLTNLLVGNISRAYGTDMALLGVVPCLGLCVFLTWLFSRQLDKSPVLLKRPVKTLGSQSLTVVRNSRYLVPLLFLIATVQIAISLIDIQYAKVVESTYPDLDIRTGVLGQIDAAMNIIATILQIFAGVIIKMIGVGGIFVGIPVALGAALIGFMLRPQFMAVAILKITSKCFDYSVFRASKEMLYIPLSTLEKTQGKALIDILVYRIAKSSAALLMILFVATNFVQFTVLFIFILMIFWVVLAVVIVKRYKYVIDLHNEET